LNIEKLGAVKVGFRGKPEAQERPLTGTMLDFQ
jgi:hypothetical protein